MATVDPGAEPGAEPGGDIGQVAEEAPAKVNLALHVTGRRPDGYHLLDSLVVFAGVGDRLTLARAKAASLTIVGAPGLTAGPDNLVLRAASALGLPAAMVLEKRLPVASGIGGGSADAAATLRGLSRLWRRPLPDPEVALTLGADVPVCLSGRPARMRGVGERLDPLPSLPPLWLVLANPGVPVATQAVFAALERRDGAPLPDLPGGWADAAALACWLSATRNDLEPAAIRVAPVIAEVLSALAAQPGALAARMSGSGATCLALFADGGSAAAARAALERAHPGWWVVDAPVLPA